jgi:hypothetical protein
VPISFKDFVAMATMASGTRAAAFAAFLVLALFVLCLMASMLLAEEYKSLFFSTEEDKVNFPLLNQFLIPVAALVMFPVAVGFCGGQRSHGCPSFQWSIHDTISIRLISHHIIQKHEAITSSLAIFSTSSFLQVLLGAGTLCSLVQEIVQDISWLPNLTG